MNRIHQAGRWLMALALPVSAGLCQAQPAPVGEVLDTPALQVARAEQAVMTALARAGERLVAVGERGLVLLSDDNGQHWRQAQVPVSVSLTAVQFVDPRLGWAVGHAGVVLKSVDGGEHWTLQLDGHQAAQIELAAARQALDNAADADSAQARVQSAERLLAEGADKPLLALQFVDARRGLVVGAYGLALQTLDGGATWQSLMGQIDNPGGAHLYAIAHQGPRWFLGGEQGYLARSEDDGQSFVALDSPYAGSFFALQLRADGALLVAGLKGHAFVSSDGGDSFQPLPVAQPVSFSAATRLADGRALLVNQGGALFLGDGPGGVPLQPFAQPLGRPVAGLIQAADGSLVLAGFTGLLRLPQPSPAQAE